MSGDVSPIGTRPSRSRVSLRSWRLGFAALALAVAAIGFEPRAEAEWREDLRSKDALDRELAVLALGEIDGPLAIDSAYGLIETTSDKNTVVNRQSVRVLRAKSAESVDTLFELAYGVAADRPSPLVSEMYVRGGAANLLAAAGTIEAARANWEGSRSPDPDLRALAASTLERLASATLLWNGDRPLSALGLGRNEIIALVYSAMIQPRRKSQDDLVEAVRSNPEVAQLVGQIAMRMATEPKVETYAVLEEFAEIVPDAFRAGISRLITIADAQSIDPKVLAILDSLGPRSASQLESIFRSVDPEERRKARAAILALGRSESRLAVLARLDHSIEVEQELALALAQRVTVADLPVLVRLSREPDPRNRRNALAAFEHLLPEGARFAQELDRLAFDVDPRIAEKARDLRASVPVPSAEATGT